MVRNPKSRSWCMLASAIAFFLITLMVSEFRGLPLEAWYVWQLSSDSHYVRVRSAERLGVLASLKGLRHLLREAFAAFPDLKSGLQAYVGHLEIMSSGVVLPNDAFLYEFNSRQ